MKTIIGHTVIDGKPVLVQQGKLTRAARKSAQREIPLTPGPRTAWQRFKRAAWE